MHDTTGNIHLLTPANHAVRFCQLPTRQGDVVTIDRQKATCTACIELADLHAEAETLAMPAGHVPALTLKYGRRIYIGGRTATVQQVVVAARREDTVIIYTTDGQHTFAASLAPIRLAAA